MEYALLFIFGLFIGSFLNVLIDRIPRNEQFFSGRSHCDSCKHALSWRDLVPVISWMLLRGRCRYCRKNIPVRNTLVELITGSLLVLNHFMQSRQTVLMVDSGFFQTFSTASLPVSYSMFTELLVAITICILIVIFFIDFDHQIIPDELTIGATVAAGVLSVIRASSFPILSTVISAVGAFLFLMALFVGTRGRGMGFGDVKFALFMGLFLGFPRIILAFYTAFLTGAFVSVMLILRKKKRFGQTIPFGPFLIIGTILSYFGFADWLWVHMLFPQ